MGVVKGMTFSSFSFLSILDGGEEKKKRRFSAYPL